MPAGANNAVADIPFPIQAAAPAAAAAPAPAPVAAAPALAAPASVAPAVPAPVAAAPAPAVPTPVAAAPAAPAPVAAAPIAAAPASAAQEAVAVAVDILNLLKSNMDIQFICDPYACVSYLTDYIVKVEKDMAKLFRTLIEQFAHEDFTNLEKVKKFANAFINTRVLAAQEAAALVLHLSFFKASRKGIFVPTFPMEERNRVVKRKKELSKMVPESTDIYQDNIIEKYYKRDKQYESMCLADFATGYSDPK
ncbi:translation initiation factor IF-2-like [Microplitis demolitor]|uniref:translation initiation factor IF-2-like n=1 Tax=Microplitis demolitor TaxID=69319 RepID=UPI00235B66B3|nr:translation initiation factor IF-2-like [Microplitis demolitor]